MTRLATDAYFHKLRPVRLAALAILVAGLGAGCATGPRGVHEIPLARDYQALDRIELTDAQKAVQSARRAGAAGFAPFAYAAAENYLSLAHAARRNRDRAGMWDYAALAMRYADMAVEASPSAVPAPSKDLPSEEAVRDAFERMVSSWLTLDHERAAYALPFLFADLTAELSKAEYLLNRGDWRGAAVMIAEAEAMLEVLYTRDIDGDGIPDFDDPDPWRPEEEPVPPPEPPVLRPIAFGSGSASLDAEGKGYLDAVAAFVAGSPDWRLHVKGHTDNRHSESYNLDLSRRRAEAVQRHLASAGAPAERVTVSYYGSSRPAQETPPGVSSAVNRRVELLLEHLALPVE